MSLINHLYNIHSLSLIFKIQKSKNEKALLVFDVECCFDGGVLTIAL